MGSDRSGDKIGKSLYEVKREKPLIPWVIYEAMGKVLCGHCNCMARQQALGTFAAIQQHFGPLKPCSVQIRDSTTVTQKSLLGFTHSFQGCALCSNQEY